MITALLATGSLLFAFPSEDHAPSKDHILSAFKQSHYGNHTQALIQAFRAYRSAAYDHGSANLEAVAYPILVEAYVAFQAGDIELFAYDFQRLESLISILFEEE